MTDATVRKPGQPKLRASCDNCGLLKLKCDRGQPECGRCESLDLICVYGPSRKTGKPRRSASRATVDASTSQPRTIHVHGGSIDKRRTDHKQDETLLHALDAGEDFFTMDIASSSNLSDAPSTWVNVTGHGAHLNTVNAAGTMDVDPLGSALNDCSFYGFGNDLLSTPIAKNPSSSVYFQKQDAFPASTSNTPRLPQDAITNTYLDGSITPLSVCSKGRDCSREAYDILGKLNLYKDVSGPSSPPTPASINLGIAERIPLDYILCVNSESRDRLCALLRCSCAGHSHLALLYASILSRMLTWYLEAAGCVRRDLCNRASSIPESAPSHPSPTASIGGSTLYWPEPTAGSVATGDTVTSPPASLGFRTTPIAMGSFHNDDQQVQTVLRTQILLGEIKRTGRLINLFTSRCSLGVDGGTLSDVDNMYRTLNTFLHREQSRVADLVRSRAEEVNI